MYAFTTLLAYIGFSVCITTYTEIPFLSFFLFIILKLTNKTNNKIKTNNTFDHNIINYLIYRYYQYVIFIYI